MVIREIIRFLVIYNNKHNITNNIIRIKFQENIKNTGQKKRATIGDSQKPNNHTKGTMLPF